MWKEAEKEGREGPGSHRARGSREHFVFFLRIYGRSWVLNENDMGKSVVSKEQCLQKRGWWKQGHHRAPSTSYSGWKAEFRFWRVLCGTN